MSTQREQHLGDQELAPVPRGHAMLAGSGCVAIYTDHASVDYEQVVEPARFVVDSRNETRSAGHGRAQVVRP